jgi:hypothetical protein
MYTIVPSIVRLSLGNAFVEFQIAYAHVLIYGAFKFQNKNLLRLHSPAYRYTIIYH